MCCKGGEGLVNLTFGLVHPVWAARNADREHAICLSREVLGPRGVPETERLTKTQKEQPALPIEMGEQDIHTRLDRGLVTWSLEAHQHGGLGRSCGFDASPWLKHGLNCGA